MLPLLDLSCTVSCGIQNIFCNKVVYVHTDPRFGLES